jgi:hypothetical protein
MKVYTDSELQEDSVIRKFRIPATDRKPIQLQTCVLLPEIRHNLIFSRCNHW